MSSSAGFAAAAVAAGAAAVAAGAAAGTSAEQGALLPQQAGPYAQTDFFSPGRLSDAEPRGSLRSAGGSARQPEHCQHTSQNQPHSSQYACTSALR